MSSGFVEIQWMGQPVQIEARWIDPQSSNPPLLVFLHEGLGSVSMWRDFPDQLCRAVNARGLVFSRRGYGRSTPPRKDERWHPTLADPVCLIGHSDGGSIALLFASLFPDRVSKVVAIAPHIVVEEVSIRSIERARAAFLEGNLKQGLARHHDAPEATFLRWNTIWLAPEFRNWSIEREVRAITCPVLAVQSIDDPYGTLEQIRGIARLAPQTQIVELPPCGHSPHRDQPQALLAAMSPFLSEPAGQR
jgi:pimeloyl-ACP methyl ester carboxylesterase